MRQTYKVPASTALIAVALASPASAAAPPAAPANAQVVIGPAPSWAGPSEPLPVPENPGGPIFMRYQDVVIHVDDKGEQQYSAQRVRLLNSSALPIGNLAIGWNPANGSATVHTLRVYRDGEVIDVLKTAKFEILRREDQLETAKLDGMLTAVLHVPDLRVGDELELATTIAAYDPTLGRNVSGLLVLGPTPPPGRYRLELGWEKDHKPRFMPSADFRQALSESADRVTMRFDNPPVRQPIKDAPPRYQWQRALEYTTFPDWPSLSRQFAPLFTRASTLAPTSPLRKEAARIATATPDPLARAAAALKLVQQDVRYILIALNGGNYTPASADETWQRRYGDCKAKTALLLALLRELGVAAEPVLVNSGGADDGLNERLPGAKLFDHVLVRAHIAGQDYWLDGTLPPVAQPSTEPVLRLRWVLPLAEGGSDLVKLGWKPASTPEELQIYDIDARTGFDAPARITNTTITRGLAGLQVQNQLSAIPPNQLADAMRQNLIGDFWQTVEEVTFRYDEKARASVLKIVGTGSVDWEKDGGGARSTALPGGGVSPPDKHLRPHGQDQNVPWYTAPDYICHVTTVRIPTGTKPGQWTSKSGYEMTYFGRHYYRAFDLRDGAIRMVRSSRIEQSEITAAAALADNARIPDFDNSRGYIFYEPGDTKGGIGTGKRIPAADEIDWTGADVPCMPAAEPERLPPRVRPPPHN